MAKKAKTPGIGYKHYDDIDVDTIPTYKPAEEVPEKANAVWTLLCCITLIEYLEPHVAGDGVKFKPAVINKATEHLNTKIIRGGLKKASTVGNKMKELKDIYQAVTYLKTRSGGSWDDDFGANIMTDADELVWAGIVASRPNCTPFKHAGWKLYDFERLDPAKPKGSNAFRPSLEQQGNDPVPVRVFFFMDLSHNKFAIGAPQ
ncbi:hypothetical protein B0H13DRAFT_1653367 [Mycena leptocephala]|nr:hypothetical protein B0H13DRAFT_1653367 [Mycena leptocephala]